MTTRSIPEMRALAAELLADPELSENHKAIVRAGLERLDAIDDEEVAS